MPGIWDSLYEIGRKTREAVELEKAVRRRKGPSKRAKTAVKVPNLTASSNVPGTKNSLLQQQVRETDRRIRQKALEQEIDRNIKPFTDQAKSSLNSVQDLLNLLVGKDLSSAAQGKKFSPAGAVLDAAGFVPLGRVAKGARAVAPLLKTSERAPRGRLRYMVGRKVVHHGSPYGRIEKPDVYHSNPYDSAQAFYTSNRIDIARMYKKGATAPDLTKEELKKGRITSYTYPTRNLNRFILHKEARKDQAFWEKVVGKLIKETDIAELNHMDDIIGEIRRKMHYKDAPALNYEIDEILRHVISDPFELDRVYRELGIDMSDLTYNEFMWIPAKREPPMTEHAFYYPDILEVMGRKKKRRVFE